MKSKKFGIARALLLALVALVFGFSLYSWNAENLAGNKMPMPFGYGASIVLTGSMEPTLSANDLVIVKKTNSINKNDIVVFQSGKSLTIHRVISVDGNQIITKGDANNTADAPIEKSAIKGTLAFRIRNVGSIVYFLKQPAVVIILLALAVFLTERSYRTEKHSAKSELDKIKQEIAQLKKEIKD